MAHSKTQQPGQASESPDEVYASTRSLLWLIEHGWYSPRPAQIEPQP